MNDDTLLSRLAPVTDEQAAAMVSRRALGELAEDIVRSASRPPLAAGPASAPGEDGGHGRPFGNPARARHHARPVNRARRRLTWAAATALAAGGAVAAAVIVTAGQPASSGKSAEDATPGSGLRPTPAASAAPAASASLAAWTVTADRDGTLKVTIREMEDPAGLQATLRADGARVVVNASLMWPAACAEWRGGNYRMGNRVVQTENRTGLPSADGTEFLITPSAIPAGALLWVGIAQTGKPSGVVGPPGPMSFGYLTDSGACARL